MLSNASIFATIHDKLLLLSCSLLSLLKLTLADIPALHLYNGHIPIEQPAQYAPIREIVAGQPYTFEIRMGNVMQQDYIVESCSLNGKVFIDNFGCVLCGDGILTSMETEQYARVGAMKRTLVHFIAKEEVANIQCNIRVLNCCGCAERSCERHPTLVMIPSVSHTLVYPIVISKRSYVPWWLLPLLLILLIPCLLALCLIPWILWWRRRRAVATHVGVSQRGVAVETEKAMLKDSAVGCRNVHQYSVDSGIHHVKPVVAVGERETTVRHAEIIARDDRAFRRAGEGLRLESTCDRGGYRNVAYERDMGRVEQLEGYDQIETSEQRHHVCGDEECDVIESDVKRTYTNRFVQETRQVEEDDAASTGERYREEDVRHAYYSRSLPV